MALCLFMVLLNIYELRLLLVDQAAMVPAPVAPQRDVALAVHVPPHVAPIVWIYTSNVRNLKLIFDSQLPISLRRLSFVIDLILHIV